jgi:hypothetical protein
MAAEDRPGGDAAAAMSETEQAILAQWQPRLEGSNVSMATLLATDYLNHFNEIIMLLGMVPDMPEILEDCRAWTPKSYQDHFRDSAFPDRDLIIAAYEAAPARFRNAFDETVARLDALVAELIGRLGQTVEGGDGDLLRLQAEGGVGAMQRLLDVASAIVHGSDKTMSQDEIDRLIDR